MEPYADDLPVTRNNLRIRQKSALILLQHHPLPDFINPIQSASTPVDQVIISKTGFCAVKDRITQLMKYCVFPAKINCPRATTNPIRKKDIQI